MPILPSTFLRPDLGLMVTEQMLGDNGFIANKVFPIFETAAISDTFSRVGVKVMSQNPDTSYAGGRPNRGDFEVVQDSYTCAPNAWETFVRDIERGRAKGRVDLDKIAAAIPSRVLMTNLEKEAAAVLNNNTNFPVASPTDNGHTVSNNWSNASTGTPLADVQLGQTAIRKKTGGLLPDTLILPYSALVSISNNDSIINRIKNVSLTVENGLLKSPELCSLFNVQRILVPGAMRDTANQGLAASISDVWSSDFASLVISAPTTTMDPESLERTSAPTLGIAQIGRTMTYAEESWGGGVLGIEQIRDEINKEDLWRAFGNWQVKLFSQAFGYRIKITT